MIYFSEKLNTNIDIDLVYEALQQGYRVSDNFHGFFLKKDEDCICYNSYGSSAYSNTKDNLFKIVSMLDKHFDLSKFRIGKDLYVNMI